MSFSPENVIHLCTIFLINALESEALYSKPSKMEHDEQYVIISKRPQGEMSLNICIHIHMWQSNYVNI